MLTVVLALLMILAAGINIYRETHQGAPASMTPFLSNPPRVNPGPTEPPNATPKDNKGVVRKGG